jgi:hypothetical protein
MVFWVGSLMKLPYINKARRKKDINGKYDDKCCGLTAGKAGAFIALAL